MVFDEGTGEMLLFGGANAATQFNDLWRRSGSSWTQVMTSGAPPTRTEANMAYDATRRTIVLFGGDGANGFWLGDTWTWNGSAWTQR